MAGRIIFLNGTSSAGKTTLAIALQEVLREPWLHMALDQFRDGLPARYRGLNAPVGSEGERGLNVVPVGGVTEVRFGDTGKQILKGMRRAIASMAAAGNNVIIDDIILEPAFLDDYLRVFAPHQVYFVGVQCPADVISEREAMRPGRFPGTAIGHLEVCHAHGCYDIEVDTSRLSPLECAQVVAGHVEREQPVAFRELIGRAGGSSQQ